MPRQRQRPYVWVAVPWAARQAKAAALMAKLLLSRWAQVQAEAVPQHLLRVEPRAELWQVAQVELREVAMVLLRPALRTSLPSPAALGVSGWDHSQVSASSHG